MELGINPGIAGVGLLSTSVWRPRALGNPGRVSGVRSSAFTPVLASLRALRPFGSALFQKTSSFVSRTSRLPVPFVRSLTSGAMRFPQTGQGLRLTIDRSARLESGRSLFSLCFLLCAEGSSGDVRAVVSSFIQAFRRCSMQR